MDEKLSKSAADNNNSARIYVDDVPSPSLVPISARVTTEFIGRTLELNNVVRRVSSGHSVTEEEKIKFSFELQNFHAVKTDELIKHFDSDETNGIATHTLNARMEIHGPNSIPPPKELHIVLKFILCFFTGFGPLLWIACFFVFLSWQPFGTPPSNVYNLALAIALLLVIFISGLFTFYQEVQTSRALAGFTSLVATDCTVIRDGKHIQIRSESLVPGDVVSLSTGVRVPSDMRILSCSNLKIDKSTLTGENEPVKLHNTPVPTSVSLLQASNMAFMGCTVSEGQGVGLVIASGAQNQLAKIAVLVGSVGTPTTSLQKDLNRFVLIIATFAGIMTMVVILEWAFFLRVQHPAFMNTSSMIANAISVLVAFVPEGLPLALSMGLTLVARRLCIIHNVLVKQMSTIETLGSMSMLCSDKTGTLTQNKMTVRNVISSAGLISIEEFTYSLEFEFVDTVSRMAVLCNQATLAAADTDDQLSVGAASITPPNSDPGHGIDVELGVVPPGVASASGVDIHRRRTYSTTEPPKMEAVGSNGIDKALLNWAYARGVINSTRIAWQLKTMMTFNSAVKLAAVVVSNYRTPSELIATGDNGKHAVVMVKGAPEHILSLCTHYLDKHGHAQLMTDAFLTTVKMDISVVASEGQRVIALAQRVLPATEYPPDFVFQTEPSPNYPLDNLTFVACLAVSDPPREGVKKAIITMRTAGIKVAMVTGDASNTAVAIAKQIALVGDAHHIDVLTDYLRDHRQASELMTSKVSNAAVVVEGKELDGIDEAGWDYIFQHREMVFARTTPDHKLMIVKEAQRRGNRVGVTGDGVNDSPALKCADVGIAMNSGSDVARDAAAIVLVKDDFAAVVEGVKEGRLIFANLRKVIGYQIAAGCWSELIPVLATFFLGMPQPLASFLMIIISCITDVAAGVALTNEIPERTIMTEPPRDPIKQPLVDMRLVGYAYLFYGTLESIASFVVYFLYMATRGPTNSVPNPVPVDDDGYINATPTRTFPAGYTIQQLVGAWNWGGNSHLLGTDEASAATQASSVFFIVLIVCQWGHLISIRRRSPYFCDAILGVDTEESTLLGNQSRQPVGYKSSSLCMRLYHELLDSTPRLWIVGAIVFSALVGIIFTEIPLLWQYCGTAHVPSQYW